MASPQYAVLAVPPDAPAAIPAAVVTTTPAPKIIATSEATSLAWYLIVAGLLGPCIILGLPVFFYVCRGRQRRAKTKEEKERGVSGTGVGDQGGHGANSGQGAEAPGSMGGGTKGTSKQGNSLAPAFGPVAVEPGGTLLQGTGSVRGELVFDSTGNGIIPSRLLPTNLSNSGGEGEAKGGGMGSKSASSAGSSGGKSAKAAGPASSGTDARVSSGTGAAAAKAVTSHPFQGEGDDELTFAKGDVLTIIGDGEDEGWLLAVDSSGNKGLVPLSRLHHRKGPAASSSSDFDVTVLATGPKTPLAPAEATLQEDAQDAQAGTDAASEQVLGPRIV